jgi:hypothetical protein
VATRRPLTAEPAGSDRVRVDTLPHLQAALSVLGGQRDFPLAAALPNTDLFGADLRDAVLQDADLSGSSLDDADLEGASIENSSLRGTSFRRTNLSQASMIKVDLRDSDFHDVKAAGMFLTGSNLAGATLSDLRAEDIDVVNVFGDSETEWPKGFDSSRVRSAIATAVATDTIQKDRPDVDERERLFLRPLIPAARLPSRLPALASAACPREARPLHRRDHRRRLHECSARVCCPSWPGKPPKRRSGWCPDGRRPHAASPCCPHLLIRC